MDVSPSPPGAAGRLGRLELAALVAVLVYCRLLAIWNVPAYDDAFITWRYAVNLAAGEGLVYNPGAPWEPVLGTTTPGYAVLLAGLVRAGLDVQVASLGFNLLCDAASALLLAQLLGRRRVATTLAVLVFAATPQIARISAGGMESPLLVLLALGATALGQAGRLTAAGTCAALACTVRPESVLLVGLLALAHVRSLRDGLRLLAPVAAVGVAYAGALTWIYGSPIPQSVQAKAASHGLGPRLARMRLIALQAFAPALWMLACLPLAVLGWWRVLRARAPLAVFVGFGLAMSAAYLAAGAKTWGWYYYAPLAVWAVGAGAGSEWLLLRSERLRRAASAGPRFALACAAFTVVAAWLYAARHEDRVTPNVYEPMRRWAREARTAERGARILASDIGALGFHADARILDSEGLVWPEAKSFADQASMVRAHRPEYVVLVANRPRVGGFLADPVSADYAPVARFNAAGEGDLEPELDSLPPTWIQDYLVFERRPP